MARIALTRPLAPVVLEILRDAGHDVVVHEDWIMDEAQLCGFVAGADVIACTLTEKITAAVLDAAGPQLKLVATYNVGFDTIDLAACAERGVMVTNTPGSISSAAVAEHAFALMMGVARHLRIADSFMRSGQYHYWGPNLLTGQELHGKRLGVIGTGQIGGLFAQMARYGLNMEIVYTDMLPNNQLEVSLGARKLSLEELLQTSDVVSIHVPLLPATQGMIGIDQLRMMKSSAILINTARGPIIQEDALVVALRERVIFGAGLDVFQYEPYLANGLAELDNVLVTPHIASATEPTRQGMARALAENILAVLAGGQPLNLVKLPEKK
jgi:glyoxylate reductase